jgi:hypothetical protein
MDFKNKALRRIFGSKRDEMIGGCRELHIEELQNFYSSPNIRKSKLKRKIRNSCKIFVNT